MSQDDTFFGSGGSDRTVLKPTPGGRRPPGSAAPPPPRAPGGASAMALPDTGLNPLVATATPLLSLVSQLRGSVSHPDPITLAAHVTQEVKNFEASARAQGESPETVLAARYALCTVLDETVLSTPWGSESSWGSQTLLTTFHNEAWGGEKFFQILDRLNQDPARNLHLLELMYICLALGFEGKYKVQERGQASLEQIQHNLFSVIRVQRGDFDRELSPHWRGVEDQRTPLARYVPLWVVGAVAGVVLALTFVGLMLSLNKVSDPVAVQLSSLGRDMQPLESRVYKTPARRITLRTLLVDDISRGLVDVTETGHESMVTVPDGLFASGTAAIGGDRLPLLQRIGAALNRVPGQVLVTGHTDNRPIRTLRFPSNWHLSRERAEAVVKVLAAEVSPERMVAEARADSDPVAPNDTSANRAKNRRVEIILRTLGGRQ